MIAEDLMNAVAITRQPHRIRWPPMGLSAAWCAWDEKPASSDGYGRGAASR